MKNLALILVLGLASVSPALGQTLVGEPIHPFNLTDLDGRTHRAADYQGKILGIMLLGHD